MNNLVLRRLRYALNLREAGIAEIFKLANATVSQKHISNLLLREQGTVNLSKIDE